jgi:hypothetical protein
VTPGAALARAAARAAGAEPDGAELVECTAAAIAAAWHVERLTGTVRAGGAVRAFTMVRKTCRPLETGPHAAAARDPAHWAYWRREPLAYDTGAVPRGPDLAAPECFGVSGGIVYLADAPGPPESPALAARRLGAWQAGAAPPRVPWLAAHQLAQRVAATDAAGGLDWSAVDAPAAAEDVWRRRGALLAALAAVPVVLCHGDFHAGNLVAGDGVTIVLDWATLGAGPAGSDLAHLALSCGEDLLGAYLQGLGGAVDAGLAELGYHATLALTAASRTHWMLAAGVPLPPGYAEAAASSAAAVERA